MKLYIDPASINRFFQISAARESDDRRYYITRRQDKANALIVTRDSLALEDLVRNVVDAAIGFDTAWQGLAFDEDVGKRRTKITIYRVIRGERRGDKSLAEVMRQATKRS